MKVDVYRNLNKKCLSVRSRERDNYGKVISHTQKVTLRNCKFVVGHAGRERVRRERKKNVHAVVRGETFFPRYPAQFYELTLDKPDLAVYNPYYNNTFVLASTGEPVLYAPMVIIDGKKIWVYKPNGTYPGVS